MLETAEETGELISLDEAEFSDETSLEVSVNMDEVSDDEMSDCPAVFEEGFCAPHATSIITRERMMDKIIRDFFI